MASLDDLVSNLKNGVLQLSNLVSAITGAFPRINGTITLTAGTTTVVAQPSIAASGIPMIVPTNASAALTVRTSGLYVSAVTAGVGFALSTQTGTAVVGSSFSYIVINPS